MKSCHLKYINKFSCTVFYLKTCLFFFVLFFLTLSVRFHQKSHRTLDYLTLVQEFAQDKNRGMGFIAGSLLWGGDRSTCGETCMQQKCSYD